MKPIFFLLLAIALALKWEMASFLKDILSKINFVIQ